MTGTSVRIIHSGLLPDSMNASMIFRRLASFFGFSSVVASRNLHAQLRGNRRQVHRLEQLADRFGADHGGEAVLAVFILATQVIVFRQQLTVLERRQAGSMTM